MDKKTKEALESSIEKWKKITKGTGVDKGPSNCPLCILFIDLNCIGCPVYKQTLCESCDDTPYNEWEDHITLCHPGYYKEENKILCDECKRIALKEIKFLESLREGE